MGHHTRIALNLLWPTLFAWKAWSQSYMFLSLNSSHPPSWWATTVKCPYCQIRPNYSSSGPHHTELKNNHRWAGDSPSLSISWKFCKIIDERLRYHPWRCSCHVSMSWRVHVILANLFPTTNYRGKILLVYDDDTN